jgi:sulfoxide reductase heme-binding subunit YedZ
MTHGGGDQTAAGSHGNTHSRPSDQRDVGLSRGVQQFTVATGYVGLGLLAATLLLGPANLLLGRRNPVSTYLRRDVGIWTAAFSLVHVLAAVVIHTSHGRGFVVSFLHFFVAEDGSLLTNSFGWGNWTGLAATIIAVALLVTSNDAALRTLKAGPWKWLQRFNYALIALVVLHAFFYGAFLRMNSPFTQLLVLCTVLVIAGQALGMWLFRQKYAGARF